MEGEGIVERLLKRVSAIAHRAVDMGHGMADRAGDAGVGGGVAHIIKLRVVKGAREKRHRVMAAGAPARGLHIPVTLQCYLARLAHAEQIGRVVERTEMMR